MLWCVHMQLLDITYVCTYVYFVLWSVCTACTDVLCMYIRMCVHVRMYQQPVVACSGVGRGVFRSTSSAIPSLGVTP